MLTKNNQRSSQRIYVGSQIRKFFFENKHRKFWRKIGSNSPGARVNIRN